MKTQKLPQEPVGLLTLVCCQLFGTTYSRHPHSSLLERNKGFCTPVWQSCTDDTDHLEGCFLSFQFSLSSVAPVGQFINSLLQAPLQIPPPPPPLSFPENLAANLRHGVCDTDGLVSSPPVCEPDLLQTLNRCCDLLNLGNCQRQIQLTFIKFCCSHITKFQTLGRHFSTVIT